MIVGTGVTGEPFHVDPEKGGTTACPHRLERLRTGVVDLLHVASVDLLPVVRLEHVERAGIDLPRRTADAVFVILNHEKHRQLSFLCETDGFEKIALPRRRIADRGHDDVRFAIELDAPGDAAGGQELRPGRRRNAPDFSRRVTIMRRHLPPVALSFPLREIIQRQFARRDSAAEHQPAVAVVRANVIAFHHRQAERRQTFVAHAGNMKMTFALTIQILLAQIAMPAFQEKGEKAQLIFFAQRGHLGNVDGQALMVDRFDG